mmetsp:Transcript_20444/g.49720  ORF Transcript_20444/g.49720 Transcript_20444/m.49720 type:complete len:108 (+) Transcript_20444:266-589(+)
MGVDAVGVCMWAGEAEEGVCACGWELKAALIAGSVGVKGQPVDLSAQAEPPPSSPSLVRCATFLPPLIAPLASVSFEWSLCDQQSYRRSSCHLRQHRSPKRNTLETN